ncbi:CAP domain-containing protein [Metabacillus arenae]|uniref:CAP domain-containing protein n=1 Tax=Metabacillus arenae TaxID=2771434 RepID=A0A926RY92_9BACI|nr:CAP domain-containing protein [Metabacillus arenae]MBD1380957.1 CAP domain-containing protein [Metabacillus arenae]
MRSIFRIVFILLIIFGTYTVFIQFSPDENAQQKQQSQSEEEDVQIASEKGEQDLDLPEDGLLALIGESSDSIKTRLGEPSRVDPSAYDFDWWIYNKNADQYVQIGVKKGKVVSVYANGFDTKVKPFKIGQSISDIYKITTITPNISIEYEGNSYRFEFSEQDMNTRPTIKLGQAYVQLYIDKFDGTLSSIRASDVETFVMQRQYEVVYRGELIKPSEKTREEWMEIEEGAERQILDITNVIRKKHDLPSVEWDEETANVAYKHSEDMNANSYFSHESPSQGTLADRLDRGQVTYQMAGENIAAQYTDGIAAVEGWLNSKGHREALLNQDFTHLGVGVYETHYTQNFIKKWDS